MKSIIKSLLLFVSFSFIFVWCSGFSREVKENIYINRSGQVYFNWVFDDKKLVKANYNTFTWISYKNNKDKTGWSYYKDNKRVYFIDMVYGEAFNEKFDAYIVEWADPNTFVPESN